MQNHFKFLLFGLACLGSSVFLLAESAKADTATFYATSSDGYLGHNQSSYSTVRNATSSSVINEVPTGLAIGQVLGGNYYIDRAFVYFDTSSLGSNVNITGATLSLYGNVDSSDTNFNITVQNGQPTYPRDPLILGDYDRNFYSGNGGSLTTVGFKTNGYNDITLNADGRGWINKTGVTKFAIRSDRDINGNTPTGQEFIWVYSSEQGAGYRPKLTVTYTVSVGSNISGYAWSENIGWISFSCANQGTCGTASYGVSINSNGSFSGYAWSENIGWIDFAPAGPYPAAPNYAVCLDLPGAGQACNGIGNYNIGGWARALSYGGGWDGWIKLRGTNYGVSVDSGSGAFSGYAWSDAVIGWVKFAGANYGVTTTMSFNQSPNKPTTSEIDWSRCSLRGGATPTFSWTYDDPENDPQSAYEIEVDEDASFNAPKFNHVVNLASISYVLDLHDDDENPDVLPPTMQDYQLDWNAPPPNYNWRVRVKDNHGNWSDWSTPSQLKTEEHASPWVDFSWQPEEPTQSETVEFAEEIEAFGGTTIASRLWTIISGTGVFVDGTNNTTSTPHIQFSTLNNTLRLEITDSDGYSCYQDKDVIVQLPLPEYKEIPPVIWFKKFFGGLMAFFR